MWPAGGLNLFLQGWDGFLRKILTGRSPAQWKLPEQGSPSELSLDPLFSRLCGQGRAVVSMDF